MVDFSVEDYERQLDLALSPLISAAKLAITRTSQVIVVVVVFVIAVHVASAVLRCYFRLDGGASRGDFSSDRGPKNVYVTAHAAPVVQVGGEGASTGGVCSDDDGAGGTLTARLRRPGGSTGMIRPTGTIAAGGEEFDSAGEDDLDGLAAVSRRPVMNTSVESSPTPVAGGQQLTLRTARRTSVTLTPQSTLEFKYSETKV